MTRNPSNSRAIKPAPSGTTTGYVDYDGGVVHAAGLPRGAPRAEANGARLVGARGAPAGWERREVEAGRVLHHVRQGKMVVRGRVDEPSRVRALQAELVPDPELAQVGLDEEDGRAGSLGRHAGQVDRRRCLTVARGRARYRPTSLPDSSAMCGAGGTARPRTSRGRGSSPSARPASPAPRLGHDEKRVRDSYCASREPRASRSPGGGPPQRASRGTRRPSRGPTAKRGGFAPTASRTTRPAD